MTGWLCKRLKISVLLLLGLGLTGLQAQESMNSAGGVSSGSEGSVSYSVGQITYQTLTGTNGSVTEGVQQPYEISVITAIEEAKSINLSVSAYPNPVTDHLILRIDDFDISGLYYQLFDVNGKLLQNKKITDSRTDIVMGDLFPSIYFVRVIKNSGISHQEVKTFKIIKGR